MQHWGMSYINTEFTRGPVHVVTLCHHNGCLAVLMNTLRYLEKKDLLYMSYCTCYKTVRCLKQILMHTIFYTERIVPSLFHHISNSTSSSAQLGLKFDSHYTYSRRVVIKPLYF